MTEQLLDARRFTERGGKGCEFCEDRNDHWTFNHRGIDWWTDRYVIIRADLVKIIGDDALQYPEGGVSAGPGRLLDAALDGGLAEPTAGFSVELAGPLTKLGLVAKSTVGSSGNAPHALVKDGAVVGVINPRLPRGRRAAGVINPQLPGDRDVRVGLPVAPEILAAYSKLADLPISDSLRWIVAREVVAV